MKAKTTEKGAFKSKRFDMLLSVMLALITWVVVVIYIDPAKSKTIEDVPVDFTYNAASFEGLGLDILNKTQIYVDIEVEGDGYIVDSLHPEDFTIYPNYTQVKGAGQYELSLTRKESSTQSNYKIIGISPATVPVQFDKIEEKKMPITVVATGIEPEIGYYMDQPVAAPGEVTLRGPVTEISRVAKVVANVTTSEKHKESSIKTAELELQDKEGNVIVEPLISMDKQTVEVTIPILEEREIPITVDFAGVPAGFDTAWLKSKMKLSETSIRVGGPSKLWDTLPSLPLGYIDLAKFTLDGEFNFPVAMPEGFQNMDKLLNVTATFDTKDMNRLPVNVTDVRSSGVMPQGLTLNVPAKAKVNNVVLIGPADELKELNPASIIAQINVNDVSKITGQQNVPVQIIIPGSNRIFASGSYTVLCNTVVSE